MTYSHKNTKIVFSSNIINDLKSLADSFNSNIFILTDSNTDIYCMPLVEEVFGHHILNFTLKSGENQKKLENIAKIWDFLNKNGADRKSILINIGGGVLCDMGGFAASTFKRGINFVQIPTTLLSQVDASVGGKTGFNFNSFKNEIGSFAFPSHVIIHTGFLKTLPKKHIFSGFGEMIKHALIKDEAYFNDLQDINLLEDYAGDKMLQLIKHSVDIKKEIVIADPTEKSVRKTLNFGHTVGHALESYFLNTDKELLHGQAVVFGMLIELYLSNIKLGFSMEKLRQIEQYIHNLYGKFKFTQKDYHSLYNLMTHDKKNSNGIINCTLLKDVGNACINQEITKTEIFEAFDLYLVSAIHRSVKR